MSSKKVYRSAKKSLGKSNEWYPYWSHNSVPKWCINSLEVKGDDENRQKETRRLRCPPRTEYVRKMQPGEELREGGGAAPEWAIRRLVR